MYRTMLIYPRRHRWLFIGLIFGGFLLVYYFNHVRKSFLTDEHRIYTSLLTELPHFERLIRLKQANLSSIQSRLTKIEKYLNKYTWHLNRLIKTIDYNKQQEKQIYRSTSFDFDLEKNIHKNRTKFLIYFHSINISNGIDYGILNEFHSKISSINSPYITFNKSEAYLNVIYLPIRSYERNLCFKDLIDKKYLVLYEFLNHIDEDINQQCFDGNFFPVKFFTKFNTNQTYLNNDAWRFNSEQNTSISIIYLKTNCKYNNELLIKKLDYKINKYYFSYNCTA